MTQDEFVSRALEIAVEQGLKVEARRSGRSICFNPRSDKWLTEHHLADLFPLVLEPGIADAKLNQMVESVAPGRPCTHVGFRRIIKQFHDECGWVPGSGVYQL